MLRCPTCHRAYPPGVRFCPDDGTPLAPAPPAEAPVRRSRIVPIAVVVGLLLAAVGTAAYVVQGPSTLETQALAAIARGDLVTPVRVSAYDFAQRLEAESPSSAATARVSQRAFAPLVAAMDDLYARFYRTSDATTAEWTRTARLAEWAARIAPADPQVRARKLYAEARLAAGRNDAAAARTGYAAAAEAWPEWALPANSLGRALADARDERGAEAQYTTAARLDPNWPFPLSNLGALYLRENRSAEAADVLARAVRLDPDRPFTHALYARALAAQDRTAEAADEAEAALSLDPTGAAGFDARDLRRDAGQWRLLAQGVTDWDGDGVVEPDPIYDDDADDYDD